MKYSKVIHYRIIKDTQTLENIEPYLVQRLLFWGIWQWVGGRYLTLDRAVARCREDAGPEPLITVRWTCEVLAQPEPEEGLRDAMHSALKDFMTSS